MPQAAIAPVLLLVIASIQIFFSVKQDLTPWKGGGFGMFSTVDSPKARFLRVSLITDDTEIPIQIPARFVKQSHVLRAMPSSDKLSDFADQIAATKWAYEKNNTAVDRYFSKYGTTTKGIPNSAPSSTMSPPSQAITTVVPVSMNNIHPDADSNLIDFHSVRVEFWKYHFDSSNIKLNAEIHASAVSTLNAGKN